MISGQTKQWRKFWERQKSPLHQQDSEEFYRLHAAELMTLTGPVAGRSVLEIGCGDGALFQHIGFSAAGRYVGVDISESMLNEFERRHPGVHLVKGDAVNLQIEGGFNLVFSNGVVQYLSKHEFERHLRCVKRLLTPRGIYVCGSVPGTERRLAFVTGRVGIPTQFSLSRLLKEVALFATGKPSLGHWYSVSDFEKLAATADMNVSIYGSLCYLYRYHAVFSGR